MKVKQGVNVWSGIEELEERREEARALTKRLFQSTDIGFSKWENRIINAAQGTGYDVWDLMKAQKKQMVMDMIEFALKKGAPFDRPYEENVSEEFRPKVEYLTEMPF